MPPRKRMRVTRVPARRPPLGAYVPCSAGRRRPGVWGLWLWQFYPRDVGGDAFRAPRPIWEDSYGAIVSFHCLPAAEIVFCSIGVRPSRQPKRPRLSTTPGSPSGFGLIVSVPSTPTRFRAIDR